MHKKKIWSSKGNWVSLTLLLALILLLLSPLLLLFSHRFEFLVVFYFQHIEVEESFDLWGTPEGDLVHPADCIEQLLEKVRHHRVNIDGNVCTIMVTTLVLEQSTTIEAGSDATSRKLREDLQAVFNILPKDVQQLMLMNPERAALVRDGELPSESTR